MDVSKSHPLRLFLALGAVAILVGGGYFALQSVQRQSAVAKVERLGGTVVPLKRSALGLRRIFGDRLLQAFDGVYLVNLRGTSVTDADLDCLEEMPTLQRLNLSQTAVTDAGLVHLRNLADLRALDLSGTRITDAGLRHLSQLNRLEYLYLDQTAVTDAGLDHLDGLSNLEHLSADNAKVSERLFETLERKRPHPVTN